MADEVLALAEHNRLTELEHTIEAGLKTFVDVGMALLEIREAKLYRGTHGTFERYCADRWQFTDRRARMLIDAAGAVEHLKTGTIVPVLPATESQARPLTQLKPERQREAWQEAVATAPGGKVTAAHVEKVVDSYRAEEATESPAQPAGQDDDGEDFPESVYEEWETVELDEEEKRNAYFFDLYQQGDRLYNQWFDAESPVIRKKYRDELFALMARVDEER